VPNVYLDGLSFSALVATFILLPINHTKTSIWRGKSFASTI